MPNSAYKTLMDNDRINTATAVTGIPLLLLRIEGAALLMLAAFLYAEVGGSWWLFAILFLSPDLSLLGYLGGARFGAIAYNAAHTLIGPLLLIAASPIAYSVAHSLIGPLLFAAARLLLPAYIIHFTSAHIFTLALIWMAHIGFDRLLGYGLKYEAGFGFTHLGHIGSASRKQL